MKIVLEKAGKQFSRNWIFRNVSLNISSPQKLAILGPNGSGKSTLLQMLSGHLSPTEGQVKYYIGEQKLDIENVFSHVSIATPYLELIEEFTLKEIVDFHFKFKNPVNNLSVNGIINIMQLENAKEKAFKYFSSGMKQRTKLAIAILSDVQLILLDEPLSNLDKATAGWYRKMVSDYLGNRIVIVCSNHNPEEYDFCEQVMNINDYKN